MSRGSNDATCHAVLAEINNKESPLPWLTVENISRDGGKFE